MTPLTVPFVRLPHAADLEAPAYATAGAAGLDLRAALKEGEVLVLADAQGKEVRVEKRAVDERVVAPSSPMPANFVDQVSEAEFYHLLAFLLQQQAPKK